MKTNGKIEGHHLNIEIVTEQSNITDKGRVLNSIGYMQIIPSLFLKRGRKITETPQYVFLMVCDSNIETSLKTYSNIINGFMGNITLILNINSYLVTYHWKFLLYSKTKMPRQEFYETRQNRSFQS